MGKFEASYETPRYGLATSFNESEVPPDYALRLRNRYINAAGGLEKRQGMEQIGGDIPSTPNMTGLHELVQKDGTVVLFASGGGAIYKYDDVSAWTEVHNGLDADAIIKSIQFDKKLIFFNGVDRNIFTEDGAEFKELKAVIERGEAAGAVSAGGIDDADVTDWVLTDVNVNDVTYNVTKDAYGVITAVTTANSTHTAIGSAAPGLGFSSLGNQEAGDRYEIIDTVALNVIPTDGEDDNTAVAGPNTDATTIDVSGVNFAETEVKVGDFVRNTTRSALAKVSAVATALTVTSIASQTSDDALVFLKSAMPVAFDAHTHYGRAYYADARDKTKVRISGINAPEDLSTSFGTLDTNTFAFGDQQPDGDVIQAMTSFQRFFMIGGKQNVFLFSGTDPIADTTADAKDFDIVGLFPQGTVSPESLVSLGNDAAFVTPDGVQTVSMIDDASTLERANISEALRVTLRGLIQNTAEDQIQIAHYPRRSWMIVKIGSQLYVFNYTSFLGQDRTRGFQVTKLDPREGSWSLFDGKMARQNFFFVRQNGDLLACGAGGKVFKCDADGVYTDDGEVYTTQYQTGWLSISRGRTRNTKIKQGNYLKPVFDVGADISYTIRAEGSFAADSGETITVSAGGGARGIGVDTIPFTIGGSNIQNEKFPLRWRGEQVRITYETIDANGPDTISRHTIYGSQWGVK